MKILGLLWKITLIVGVIAIILGLSIVGCTVNCANEWSLNTILFLFGIVLLIVTVILYLLGKRKK